MTVRAVLRKCRAISCFFLLGDAVLLCACDVQYVDKNGNSTTIGRIGVDDFQTHPKVLAAMAWSQSEPSDVGLRELAALAEAADFSAECSGNDELDYVYAYHAIGILRYRFNHFATSEMMAESAAGYLKNCIAHAGPQLVGPALEGIGLHGTREDADAIFRRMGQGDEQQLLTYAAMGLKYVCDPVAGRYMKELMGRSTDARVKASIATNMQNRVFITSKVCGSQASN